MLHINMRICSQGHHKAKGIINQNIKKGGMNKLDKLLNDSSCKTDSLCLLIVIFCKKTCCALQNTFDVWMILNIDKWKAADEISLS